jgi:hypothetical protein
MTAIIVNDCNETFCGYAAQFSPRYDGDDDTFTRIVWWGPPSPLTKVYSSRRSAERALKRIKPTLFSDRFAVVS